MPKRTKRGWLDDGDSSGDSSASDGEGSSAPRPAKRGMFDEDDEEPATTSTSRSSKLAKPVSFVSGGESTKTTELPTTFGSPALASSSKPKPSFVQRASLNNGNSSPAPQLSREEKKHFDSISGSFGARLMAKMGWEAGTGLGANRAGIVTPIEAKLRPASAGIAFGGFKEKTEQSKAEARRRGEKVSDDDEPKARPRRGRATPSTQEDHSQAWKKEPKKKTKVEHMTYEQIIESTEDTSQASSGIGIIIDATGATPREVSSLADVSNIGWAPTAAPEYLPEVRHNLRLLTNAAKSELDGFSKEAKALEQRRAWATSESAKLQKTIDFESKKIERLQKINIIVEDIGVKVRQTTSSYEATLDTFTTNFDDLVNYYQVECVEYALDEVAVGAITPLVRRMVSQWKPLEEPTFLTSEFWRWRKLFRINEKPKVDSTVALKGDEWSQTGTADLQGTAMTPYESLLWNAWLPKLRSTINNEWSPADPQPLINVIEAWTKLLPPFLTDNVFDQLVLPKLEKAISSWTTKDDTPLHVFVLPWLPHIGLRVGPLVDESRRKLRATFRSWSPSDGMPPNLLIWKEVLKPRDWDEMLLKYVVPKLGATLREDFKVNPRNQDMTPLHHVAPWVGVLKPNVFSQLLEAEFFPKWLNVLHLWLAQPSSNYNEVAAWYEFWKGSFSESVLGLPRVADGFTRGLQLMNEATALSPENRSQLPKPSFKFGLSAAPSSVSATPAPAKKGVSIPEEDEVSFRSLVEETAASHNLLFIPLGQSDPTTRLPLFRVAQNIDGRGGVTVYLHDDAVWAAAIGAGSGGEFKAISLDEMVLRATKAKR